MSNKTSQLTQDGLFFVLGKLYYFEILLTAQFEDEVHSPIGVEEVMLEIEEVKEPLHRLLLGPPDIRQLFSIYLKETYKINVNFDYAIPPYEDEMITFESPLSLVLKKDE